MKPKVVHIDRMKLYTSSAPFDWFQNKKNTRRKDSESSTEQTITTNSELTLAESKSAMGKEQRFLSKDNDEKSEILCRIVTEGLCSNIFQRLVYVIFLAGLLLVQTGITIVNCFAYSVISDQFLIKHARVKYNEYEPDFIILVLSTI